MLLGVNILCKLHTQGTSCAYAHMCNLPRQSTWLSACSQRGPDLTEATPLLVMLFMWLSIAVSGAIFHYLCAFPWETGSLFLNKDNNVHLLLLHFSRVQLFVTPETVPCQAPLSMGILQARILEWVAMPSSRGSSQPRD